MPFMQQAIVKVLLPFFLHTSLMPTFDENPLKDRFNAAGTPVDLPSYDPGMTGQLIQVSFSQVIRSAGKNADLIMIGDTNHKDPDVRGSAMNKESLVAMAESGVTHLFVEVDQKLQPLVDKLIENKNDPNALREFGRQFNEDYGSATGNETGAYTRQLAETILTGDRLGIQVHFANPGNGWKENEDAINYAAANPDDNQGIEARFKVYNEARFDDHQLAEFITKKANGEKSAMIYGSLHGSRFGDFEDSYNGRAVKIDIYNNLRQFQQKLDIDAKGLAENGMKFNEDKPELVYFKDSQIAATTYNTPSEMSQDLRINGQLIDTPEGREDPIQPQQQVSNNKQSLGMSPA